MGLTEFYVILFIKLVFQFEMKTLLTFWKNNIKSFSKLDKKKLILKVCSMYSIDIYHLDTVSYYQIKYSILLDGLILIFTVQLNCTHFYYT